ncbi:BMP family lipoprotein [Mesobacillus zeae]|uniref:BMP family ABC transporter substrate-binding protein n=1 Tax=Mesobacillus zeae TaxID=1917180 RepID=A0A398BEN1_9BACI|nr:BMP family protein [Mesobacillus zeae]RID88054.1 BMP family ABC transporter substrate-binding protein [Mesobacillus zeae]
MKKRKFGLALSLVLAAGTILGACGSDEGDSKKGDEKKKTENFKVGLVTDTGGVDDKSFNQSSWEGLKKFGKEFGLEEGKSYRYLQSEKEADYIPNLGKFADGGFNLTFAAGFLLEDAVQTAAEQNSGTNFALIDSLLMDEDFKPVFLDNVAAVTFEEHQGSFLVGVVAAKQSKTGKVGFIGGVDSPLIKKFENGFKAGVKSVNPDMEIIAQYAGDFNKPEKGSSIASTMYTQGADIIYHAAGGTGNGVFTEAKNRKKNGEDVWVIGVDRDQHEEGMPENVTLTSMVKRVDVAVYEISKMAMDGKFPGGKESLFGIKENAIGIAESQENVSKESLKLVDEYKEKILKGEIKVPKTDKEFAEFEKSL